MRLTLWLKWAQAGFERRASSVEPRTSNPEPRTSKGRHMRLTLWLKLHMHLILLLKWLQGDTCT